ncbi:flavodoxin family protein [Streptomyces sp. NBC_01352]|uniref:flavodoxin family protein n=1 Tax=Streptomyces sp. NBC_01352 TaxID=2903834 RepID=UPI002E30CDF8|nr:flavodoxin family protein [Streptomyces sp. NBC_01352]
MKALVINCTLKRAPEPSNTGALAGVVAERLEKDGVEVEVLRAVDLNIEPGVTSEPVREGDVWPGVHDKLLDAEILVTASPTRLGRPSSVAWGHPLWGRVLERMDALMSETDDEGRPVAYNRVAGVVVTGNEDGAHHVISEISGALADLGCTIPGQAWTYWHLGPGPGPDHLDDERGRDWSHRTGRAMAANLFGVASALAARPVSAPPG